MAETQLVLMQEMLNRYHPGSYVGVTSFRDKPIWSLGEPNTDYCQNLICRSRSFLQSRGALSNIDFNWWWRSSGKPVWSYDCNFAIPNPKLAFCSGCDCLIVLSTDAGPHFEGDGFNNYGLAPFSGVFDQPRMDEQCTGGYYPTVRDLNITLQTVFASAWNG